MFTGFSIRSAVTTTVAWTTRKLSEKTWKAALRRVLDRICVSYEWVDAAGADAPATAIIRNLVLRRGAVNVPLARLGWSLADPTEAEGGDDDDSSEADEEPVFTIGSATVVVTLRLRSDLGLFSEPWVVELSDVYASCKLGSGLKPSGASPGGGAAATEGADGALAAVAATFRACDSTGELDAAVEAALVGSVARAVAGIATDEMKSAQGGDGPSAKSAAAEAAARGGSAAAGYGGVGKEGGEGGGAGGERGLVGSEESEEDGDAYQEAEEASDVEDGEGGGRGSDPDGAKDLDELPVDIATDLDDDLDLEWEAGWEEVEAAAGGFGPGLGVGTAAAAAAVARDWLPLHRAAENLRLKLERVRVLVAEGSQADAGVRGGVGSSVLEVRLSELRLSTTDAAWGEDAAPMAQVG